MDTQRLTIDMYKNKYRIRQKRTNKSRYSNIRVDISMHSLLFQKSPDPNLEKARKISEKFKKKHFKKPKND